MEITRIYYHKLVRDKIKDRIEAKGAKCEIRQIEDQQEFQQELFKKVGEEASSLAMAKTKEDFLGEYCDLMTALEALIQELDIGPEEMQEAWEKNYKYKGDYDQRHFLHWSDDLDYQSNDSPQGIATDR